MITNTKKGINYEELIKESEVHSSLYTNPDIFNEEMEKIWYRGWVYTGHESEIPNPGDYCTKLIGQQPVIMTRDNDGLVNVLTNKCPHLGNEVCQNSRGNTRSFRCNYHGWAFNNNGESLTVPYREGYGDWYKENNDKFSLSHLPRMESYRGFVFTSMAQEGISLMDHLGQAKDVIDRLCDLSPEGEIQLAGGWLKHKINTNWKVIYENEFDGYHPHFTHQSMAKLNNWSLVEDANAFTESAATQIRYFGNGHAEIDYIPQFSKVGKKLMWVGTPKEEKLSGYINKMEERYGKEISDKKLLEGPPHAFIYPNLFIAEIFMLVVQPVSVGVTIQNQTAILFKGADDLNKRIIRQTGGSMGPAGLVIVDDGAMYERTWKGLQAGQPEWLIRSRGLNRETIQEDGIKVSQVTDDTAHRASWQYYKSLMSE